MTPARKICPRCQTPTDIEAAFCACGHRFRTAAPINRTTFLPGKPEKAGSVQLTARQWWAAGVAAVVLLLALTNPSRGDYLAWLTRQYIKAQRQGFDPNPVMSTVEISMGMSLVNNVVEEQNFLLGTFYWVDFPGERTYRVLGVARMFIPLDPTPTLPRQRPAPITIEPPRAAPWQPEPHQMPPMPNFETPTAPSNEPDEWQRLPGRSTPRFRPARPFREFNL